MWLQFHAPPSPLSQQWLKAYLLPGEDTSGSLLCDHQAHPRPETEGHQLLCILTPPWSHLELSLWSLMGHAGHVLWLLHWGLIRNGGFYTCV